ncbi:hypothetical protein GCM10028808_40440 [Spirosoma migulaei]
MNAWSNDDCKEMAYDITMEAVVELLFAEKLSPPVIDKYDFLIDTVTKYLNRVKFKRLAKNRKNSTNKELLSISVSESAIINELDRSFITNDLSIREKTLIQLKDEGYKGHEIASLMSTSPASISRLLYAIKKKFNIKK